MRSRVGSASWSARNPRIIRDNAPGFVSPSWRESPTLSPQAPSPQAGPASKPQASPSEPQASPSKPQRSPPRARLSPPSSPERDDSRPAEQGLVDEIFAVAVGDVRRMREMTERAAAKRASRDKCQALGVPLFHALVWGDTPYAAMFTGAAQIQMSPRADWVRSYECEIRLTAERYDGWRARFIRAAKNATCHTYGIEEIIADERCDARPSSCCDCSPVQQKPQVSSTWVRFVLNTAQRVIRISVGRQVRSLLDVASLGAWEEAVVLEFLAEIATELP